MFVCSHCPHSVSVLCRVLYLPARPLCRCVCTATCSAWAGSTTWRSPGARRATLSAWDKTRSWWCGATAATSRCCSSSSTRSGTRASLLPCKGGNVIIIPVLLCFSDVTAVLLRRRISCHTHISRMGSNQSVRIDKTNYCTPYYILLLLPMFALQISQRQVGGDRRYWRSAASVVPAA